VATLQADITADNLPKLKTDLATITTEVDKLISQMDLTEPSALDSHLNVVGDTATDALRIANDAELCCTTTTGNLNDDVNDLGGKASLPNLGSIAKWLFGIGAVMSIVDTVATILDFPATFAATAADTEAIATWADSAANQLITNKSYPAWMVP